MYQKKMTLLLLLCFLLLSLGMSLSNEWSECSRTCGTGISHRIISCQKNDCNGTEKEFRSCSVKECPGNYTDFRKEQCQKHGEGMVPFINTSDPCKLICMLPGQQPVDKGTAVDGTLCLSDSICIDGTCVPVGCNGILGSEEKIDECGRCGSTNGICLHVPCMVNHEPNTNEYTTTMPVGSTKINITWTQSCRISALGSQFNILYLNNNSPLLILTNQSLVDGKELTMQGPLKEQTIVKINCQEGNHTMTCGYHVPLYDVNKFNSQNNQAYQWVIGNGFTKCSQTCGIGVQKSTIYCQNIATEKIAEATFCNNLSTKHLDVHLRKCYMPPCPYEWQVTDWSSCSKSCGGGHRSRNVTCVQVFNKLVGPTTKDPTNCSKNKPRSQEMCNHHHCYIHWYKGPWSDCSSSCGNGTRKRSVTCINAYGMEVEINYCSLPIKPKEENKCTGKMCTYKWTVSDWSNCSVHCGQGNQTRNVYCQHIKDRKAVKDRLCMQRTKPATIKQCQGSGCTGKWVVEDWGLCEAVECNSKGIRQRNYFCIFNGSITSHFDCDNSTKPNTVEECYKSDDCIAHWVALPWKQCNKACNGIRVRGLVCMMGNKIVDDTKCTYDKPDTVEKCNIKELCLIPDTNSCTPKPLCRSILRYISNQDILNLCKKNCCNLCESL